MKASRSCSELDSHQEICNTDAGATVIVMQLQQPLTRGGEGIRKEWVPPRLAVYTQVLALMAVEKGSKCDPNAS